jgi:hypothetical protein
MLLKGMDGRVKPAMTAFARLKDLVPRTLRSAQRCAAEPGP